MSEHEKNANNPDRDGSGVMEVRTIRRDVGPRGDGRDALGHFLPGNHQGIGNPGANRTAEWRAALVKTITPKDVEAVVGKLKAAAKAGEPWAIKEFLDRCLGKPIQTNIIGGDLGPAIKIIVGIQEDLI